MGKKSVLLFILAMALLVSGCCACCSNIPTPTPVPYVDLDDPGQAMPADRPPGAAELVASKNVIMAAAQAIDAGDGESFLLLLSSSSRADYEYDLDLKPADAKRLAGAMRNATFIGGSEHMLIYEFTVDGQKVTVYTIKEGGVWKLHGL